MIIQCAWCKTVIGIKEPYDTDNITHSICEPCMVNIDKKIKQIKVKVKGVDKK